jgi:tellurium resistance protein TerD
MDTVNLNKGSRIQMNLTKGMPGMSSVKFALGWDEGHGADDLDPDACMAVLHGSRPFASITDLLWYNSNKATNPDGSLIADTTAEKNDDGSYPYKWADTTRSYPFILNGALASSGDNRDGAGASGSDKEVINIDFNTLPDDVTHLVPMITIYEATTRKQNFGNMPNTFARIDAPNVEGFVTQRSDLTEDATAFTAFIPGYFYKKDGLWKYHACMLGINANTVGADGKTLAEHEPKETNPVNAVNIAENLIEILGIQVTA